MTFAEQIAQYLASGLVVGGAYALIGLGFVIVYSVTRIINFAQGEFVMLGALLMVTLVNRGAGPAPAFSMALATIWMASQACPPKVLRGPYLASKSRA